MVGEVTQDSAILKARLTKNGKVRWGDISGQSGVGAFVLSQDEDFDNAFRTRWVIATEEGDFILKTKVANLQPGVTYYYRLLSGEDIDSAEAGPTGTFRTLDQPGTAREVSFVTVTGLNRFAFRALSLVNLDLEDFSSGFPALETITSLNPDFMVFTGDNVYYDTPFIGRGQDLEGMRSKWHRQFSAPRFEKLFLDVPTYWEKDDHDFRYEDSDPHGPYDPSPELGAFIFREQVSVTDPLDEDAVTYRTHRVNDLLQIWLLESRDHRDANTDPPGPQKSMWGAEQLSWLKDTLLESDAEFKIIISSVPMVGPDDEVKGVQGGILAPFFGGRPLGQGGDKRKRDNQTNEFGFIHEGQAFFAWLEENGFLEENTFILCGDRHWQYHSINPAGFHEFSVGALVDANARLGPKPGDPASTDPNGLVDQVYSQDTASGGFLETRVYPPSNSTPAVAEFTFYDECGGELYSVKFEAVR